MQDLHIVVLAAGKGTRMRSALPKVLHPAAGLPLIDHVLRAAASLSPSSIIVVVGHEAERLKEGLREHPGLSFAVQEPQLGTGHALLQAEPFLRGARGTVVLLSGDVPLLRASTLGALVRTHEERQAAATVLTAVVDAPAGYGRIVRDGQGIAAIVEHKDASAAEREIREINSGIYAFDAAPLFAALREIGSANAQGEYYLPDLVRIYRARGLRVDTVTVEDSREILGVNSRKELAEVGAILKANKNEALMAAGVTLVDPATAYIGPEVIVGPDTVIHPAVHLEGRTRVGSGCEIHSGVRIVNTTVDDDVVINDFCVILDSHISRGAKIGPFAHIRPLSDVGEGAHVGNFVELKKTTLGPGSKANHLAYLGDSTIGARVNVGAGVITCNYDGTLKHPTVIEDGAFIGSDSQLVAPVTVRRGATLGAGTTLTRDAPADALTISRARQFTVPGWQRPVKKKPAK